MQASGFQAEKFPFTTKNEELKKEIADIISAQEKSLDSRVASLNEQGKAFYKQCLENHKKIVEMATKEKWEQQEGESDWSSYTVSGEDGLICLKSVATIKRTPIEILAFLRMEKYKTEYDLNFLSGKVIEVFPPNMKIWHMTFKGNMLVSNRDFVTIQNYALDQNDGSILSTVCSITDPRVPPSEDAVRGQLTVFSFAF